MDKYNNVVLVNSGDEFLGTMDKNRAHHEGVLHRAVSVFIFNCNNELLLQKRADNKYHSPGKWSNACCTHPIVDETYLHAAKRRLKEEMGIETVLEEKMRFIYMAKLDNGMTEHELDAVFFGVTDEKPVLNEDEVSDYKYMSSEVLSADMDLYPENYTPWFRKIVKKLPCINEKEKLI